MSKIKQTKIPVTLEMSWNHRVMKSKDGDDYFYQIHEVNYDKEGKVDGYTARGTSPCGNSLQELKEDLERMLKSLDKEVLDYERTRN